MCHNFHYFGQYRYVLALHLVEMEPGPDPASANMMPIRPNSDRIHTLVNTIGCGPGDDLFRVQPDPILKEGKFKRA